MAIQAKTCPETKVRWTVSEQSRAFSAERASIASIEISLNNTRCNGAYLAFQILWAHKAFSSVEFAVGDTLHRYDYVSIGHPRLGILDLRAAEEVARSEGDEWCEKNRSTIESLCPSGYRIRRWDEWRAHPDFPNAVERATEVLLGETLGPLVTQDALRFAEKHGISKENFSGSVRESLIGFIVEEVAGYYLHSRNWPVAHIYAGKPLRVLRYLGKGKPVPETSDQEFIDVLRSRQFAYLDLKIPEISHDVR